MKLSRRWAYLLTRPGLTHPEVSSVVFLGFFCLLPEVQVWFLPPRPAVLIGFAMLLFWASTACRLVATNVSEKQIVSRTESRRRWHYVSPYLPTNLHDVKNQDNNAVILASGRTTKVTGVVRPFPQYRTSEKTLSASTMYLKYDCYSSVCAKSAVRSAGPDPVSCSHDYCWFESKKDKQVRLSRDLKTLRSADYVTWPV
jgi:hypothetical protein